ncbi:MAG: hypothetical protein LJE61_11280 [Thiocapsa sp.]|jgi:formamidopyrimidine-DNA glycosylase|nr:hypothetical protein [Thiocapsa sp.]MCG6895818.1 hypothetical protein [Thiocapsa sp.]MCG6985763.1 hypothetical protein [Thiocapsa sp.]
MFPRLHEHTRRRDALDLSEEALVRLASGHRGGINSWLMNRQVMARMAKRSSDEVLFQTEIHPSRAWRP